LLLGGKGTKLIDICVIPPFSNLPLSELGDRDFCLVQNLKIKNYHRYYQEAVISGRWVILDNGTHENRAPAQTIGELIGWALDLEVAEVVAPDVLYCCDGTINLTNLFFDKVAKQVGPEIGFQVMGVAQGQSFDEWLHCYMMFYQDPRIDTIGITYDTPEEYRFGEYKDADNLPQKYMVDRARKLEMIEKYNLTKKPIHLLGMINLLELIYVAFKFEFVRSWDSSNTIIRALLDKSYNDYSSLVERHGKTELKEKYGIDYFQTEMTLDQYALAKENIRIVKSFTQGHGRGWLSI
jgi:hypothetical protein